MQSLLAPLTSQLTGSQVDLVYNLYNLIVQAAMMERTWVAQEVGRASVARIGSWQRNTTTSEALLSYHAP